MIFIISFVVVVVVVAVVYFAFNLHAFPFLKMEAKVITYHTFCISNRSPEG